jgi:2-polyprenyl-6-methoxyphenol hydroxylase-like FAD-dependent oxidoreductase
MILPVLIAGGGPVGMTVALELGRRGIRCMLIERNETTTKHPKMDITNARSMELFRRMGIIPELRAAAVAPSHPFDVSWITSFAGHELHRFRYANVDEAYARIRQHNDGTQPLEAPMRVSQVEIEPVLKRAVDRHPLIDVRFGMQLVDVAQDADGTTATLRRKSDGGTETVRAQYLVGSDGGGSQVRRCLGIGLSGQPNVMQRFMTHFKSDARELLQRWGYAWHYQSAHGTLIAQNDHDTWTLHTRFPESAEAQPDPAALIRKFVGKDIEHQVMVANPWVPHLVVADSYGHGRILIAGDSAHQYIPTGGYGMNTGIGDACDVAWKLAAMLSGFGGPGLIESYEAERRPIGLRNRDGSGRHNQVRVQIGKLYEQNLEAPGAEGEAARAHASEQIRQIGNAENESFGIEFGYVYADSPIVVAESRNPRAPTDTLNYVPSTMPGARLPSVYLADGSALFDHLGDWFALLVVGKNDDAAAAFQAAAKQRGMPLKIVPIEQTELLSIYEAPLILVRPDQHVAWRANAIADAAAADRVLAKALGWSNSAAA